MMEIYLVRHTTPAIEKGICYGQSDIDVTESFQQEASIIQNYLPQSVAVVFSSPLQRCSKLATHLFPAHHIHLYDELMEINCGVWEGRRWNDIPTEEITPWMNNFVQEQIPGGESYVDLFERVSKIFDHILLQSKSSLIVAHGGVIRSILSYITNTDLKDSFNVFSLHYGCVIKLSATADGYHYEVLSNIAHEKETHKPSFL